MSSLADATAAIIDRSLVMQKLVGKTALITGGGSGIGLATARLFREHGARVAITGRNASSLQQACATLGADVFAIQSDAASLPDIDALVSEIGVHFGKLDILFVNAAIASPAPFAAVTEQQFDEIIGINLKGAFFTVQKALPLLGHGSCVVLTTSISNRKGSPNFSVYAASKAALRSLTQTLGLELIQHGIRVNAISPGPIATPMWGKFGLSNDAEQARKDEIADKSPIRRFADPDEVAKMALFLASNDSSYIVGEEIVVDGGMGLL